MKVYKITMQSEDGKSKHYSFYRTVFLGNLWHIVEKVTEEAEKKSKKEKRNWAVIDIKRI